MIARDFPISALEYIVCQQCFGELHWYSAESNIHPEGVRCSNCKKIYAIENGILLFLSDNIVDGAKKNEIDIRDQKAKTYDTRLAARYQKEVISTLRAIGNVEDKVVLEQGAGTGRLTEVYAPQAKLVIACDFSIESLRVLQQKNISGNIALVHADATTLQVKNESIDLVIATQFYEHIPDVSSREAFVLHTHEALKHGGRFISTTYHYDARMRFKRVAQEGLHPGGIFYHYYTCDVLRKEFASFQVDDIHPIDITLPLEARLKLPARLAGYLSRMLERVPYVSLLGHLVLVSAKKK